MNLQDEKYSTILNENGHFENEWSCYTRSVTFECGLIFESGWSFEKSEKLRQGYLESAHTLDRELHEDTVPKWTVLYFLVPGTFMG